MNGLLQRDKRGVTPIIGYVLLVVFALSISGAVYYFLSKYTPSSDPICSDDVSLSIQKLSCQNGEVNITLMNRGLFSVDGAYIRVGDPGRQGKTLINCPNPQSAECKIYFSQEYPGDSRYGKGLAPGDTWGPQEPYEYTSLGEKEIEIQPLLFLGDEAVPTLCEKAVISQRVTCA